MANKIRVHDCIDKIHPDDGIDSIISTLQNISDMVNKGELTNVTIETVEESYLCREWYIWGYRLETDKELKLRLDQEEKRRIYRKKQKLEKEDRERKQYEILKAKYG